MKKWTRWFFHGDLADHGQGFFCRNCCGFFPQKHFAVCSPSDHRILLELTEQELTESPDRWHPKDAVNIFRTPAYAMSAGMPILAREAGYKN